MNLSVQDKNLIVGFSLTVLVLTVIFWLIFFWAPSLFGDVSSEEKKDEEIIFETEERASNGYEKKAEVEEEAVNYLEEEDAVMIETENEDEEVTVFETENEEEEVTVIETENEEEELEVVPVKKTLFEYIEVVDSCNYYFEGECLRVRSGPGLDFPVVLRLRNGQVLKVGGSIERDDYLWYKIVFDEWIRYPSRLTGDWYVVSDYVEILLDEGARSLKEGQEVKMNKKIVVVRNEQRLYAYEEEEIVMEFDISTGLRLTPTPRGEFKIFRKTPTRYMQGPLPGISYKYWDLPGVPWNLYFTHEGAVIHGAYWHNGFGGLYSNGCVNLRPEEAKELYNWVELGTKVIVQN